MTKEPVYKVEVSFAGSYWTEVATDITKLFDALDILKERQKNNGALDYRIVKVEEEVVYEG